MDVWKYFKIIIPSKQQYLSLRICVLGKTAVEMTYQDDETPAQQPNALIELRDECCMEELCGNRKVEDQEREIMAHMSGVIEEEDLTVAVSVNGIGRHRRALHLIPAV
jgi:hypothetical protein